MLQPRTARSDSLDCSVLVLSCDGYRDLWPPFFHLFEQYWAECPMPVFLGTQCARVDLDWVTTLQAGADKCWSRRLRFFLESIHTDYVLLLLEDFFLDRTVSNTELEGALECLKQSNGWEMRLFPNPPADYIRKGVGVLHPRAWYRVSLQAAIWNRRLLLSLLVDGESPWEFEVRGSQRSRAQASGFYSVLKPAIHYRHVVERGEWFRSAAAFYAAQSIGCNFHARPTIGRAVACKKIVLNRIRKIVNRVHSRWIQLS